MLATKLLIKENKAGSTVKTEPFFEGLNNLYSRSLAAFLRKRWIALPFTAATILIIGFLWNHIPAEMAPLEDRSQISINTRGSKVLPTNTSATTRKTSTSLSTPSPPMPKR